MKIGKNRHRLGGEKRAERPTKSQAQSIALRSLIFLAQDDERMQRFLALTGVDPQDVRALSRESGFQLALLDHLCADEALLLAFASADESDPEEIVAARFALGGGDFD